MLTKQTLHEQIKTDNKRKRTIVWIAIVVTAIVAIIAAILLINCITLPEPTKPGLYNERNWLVASWDTLVNKYGMDVETDHPDPNLHSLSKSSPSYVLTENKKLANGTKLIIPDGVSKIGSHAFRGCDNLTNVIISDSVTSIGECAFNSCERLTTVTLGNNITSIGDNAFSFSRNLTGDLVIPDSVTTIDFAAFSGCDSIKSITIGKSVTSIANHAFSCFGLENIVVDTRNTTYHSKDNCLIETATNALLRGCDNSIIPDYVTTIGDEAFSCCANLTNVTIPDSVTTIDKYAFYKCTSLTSVTIGNNVQTISRFAFQYCTSLTSITIPDSVTTIGGSAFSNCTNLTNVTIGDNVTTVGGGVFINCPNLNYNVYDGCQYLGNIDNPYVVLVKAMLSDAISCVVHKDTKAISSLAFSHNRNLTGILVDENNPVYSNDEAGVLFNKDKTVLVQVPNGIEGTYIIPDSVTTIGENAFYDCESLTSVTIPDGVTTICDSAFEHCTDLTSVTIGDNVTTIGRWAFYECNRLKDVYITDIAAWCHIDFSGDSSGLMRDGVSLYINGVRPSGELVIPEGVTRIADRAFKNCDDITSVVIPYSVTTIGGYAFSGCSNLTNVTIGDSVTTIGSHAFSRCHNLANVTIPDSVKTIGNCAFEFCTSLTSMTIPDSVTTIGNSAFESCDSLTSVTIPDSITTIGSDAFSYCTNLTSITMPNSVTTIGEHAFAGCTSLNNINVDDNNLTYCDIDGVLFNKTKTTLVVYPCGKTATSYYVPDGVTTIGVYAFFGCTNLTSVIIPDSVTTIGEHAFSRCASLTNIHFQGTKKQWHAINKNFYWKSGVPAKTVICTDGTVDLQ